MTLVAEHPFDEGTGEGRYGGAALASTGVGAQIPVTSTPAWTVMLDVYLEAGAGWRSIIEAPGGAFYLELGGLVLDFYGSSPVVALQGPTLTAGWHHLAVTAGAGQTRLVIDGATFTSAATVASLPTGNYYVGGSPGQPLTCRVDNLRIYDTAMTDAAIAEAAAPPEHPTSGGWWLLTGTGLKAVRAHTHA